jgi:hypothetical protein
MLVWRGVAVAVLAGGLTVGYFYYDRSRLLSTVTTANYRAGLHVAGPIAYAETPPVGGPHNLVWQNCAIYDWPIHSEHAVHSLEHGAVWITYRPDLPADQVEILKGLAADDYMLLSPYPGLPRAVVASSWNHQLLLDRADEPALRAFIGRYKNNPSTTPEFGASCAGATSLPATADSLNSVAGAMGR